MKVKSCKSQDRGKKEEKGKNRKNYRKKVNETQNNVSLSFSTNFCVLLLDHSELQYNAGGKRRTR